MNNTTTLNAHRYQFNCRVNDALALNFYSGSMLRGAFGRALRKTVCVTGMSDCHSCLLYRQCHYPKIFETPAPKHSQFQQFSQIPNPFVIEPPPMGKKDLKPGDLFSFNLVLIGQAISQLPIILVAWQKALSNGLGKQYAKAELLNVVYEPATSYAQTVFDASNGQLIPIADHPPIAEIKACDSLNLRLLTPLRIQQHGKVLSQNLQGKDFIMALVRRYYLLDEFHGPNYQAPDFKALAAAAQTIQCQHQLRWCDWERYSNRQQQSMVFGGVLGELTLSGQQLAVFLPLLNQGQWLHLGNKTTFGMGHYQITSNP